MARFDVEGMPVYAVARDLHVCCAALSRRIRRRRRDLADQLVRAAASVPVNIAEGAGEYRPREKARFYRIARRSATECAGILDAILDCGEAAEEELAPIRALAGQSVAQLVLLGKAMDTAAQKKRREPK